MDFTSSCSRCIYESYEWRNKILPVIVLVVNSALLVWLALVLVVAVVSVLGSEIVCEWCDNIMLPIVVLAVNSVSLAIAPVVAVVAVVTSEIVHEWSANNMLPVVVLAVNSVVALHS